MTCEEFRKNGHMAPFLSFEERVPYAVHFSKCDYCQEWIETIREQLQITESDWDEAGKLAINDVLRLTGQADNDKLRDKFRTELKAEITRRRGANP
jgi:hypothetical protein